MLYKHRCEFITKNPFHFQSNVQCTANYSMVFAKMVMQNSFFFVNCYYLLFGSEYNLLYYLNMSVYIYIYKNTGIEGAIALVYARGTYL